MNRAPTNPVGNLVGTLFMAPASAVSVASSCMIDRFMVLHSPDSPQLPPTYAGWIGQLLQAPIPEETEATCSDCAM
jgi:hypothetical protein